MQKLFRNQRSDRQIDVFAPQNDKAKTANYNFNVEQKTDDEGFVYYEHDTLIVQWPLTRRNVFKSLLEALYPLDLELKLINDYNTEMSSDNPNQEKINAYQVFLQDRETLRQQVINDCITHNIPEV